MVLMQYDSAADFLQHVESTLEADEVANSLALGILHRLVEHPNWWDAAPYLAAVGDDDDILLVCMMTPPEKLLLASPGSVNEPALRVAAEHLAAGGWTVPGVTGAGETSGRFAEIWGETTGVSYTLEMAQRVFALHEVMTPRPARGRLRLATNQDEALVAAWCYQFQVDAFGEGDREHAVRIAERRIRARDFFLWEVDGEPVSMALKTRPLQHGISVTYVFTPARLRRRGYATACVAELSRSMLASGYDYVALFTDLANPTSNRIYQEIGYRPVCDFMVYAFGDQ